MMKWNHWELMTYTSPLLKESLKNLTDSERAVTRSIHPWQGLIATPGLARLTGRS